MLVLWRCIFLIFQIKKRRISQAVPIESEPKIQVDLRTAREGMMRLLGDAKK